MKKLAFVILFLFSIGLKGQDTDKIKSFIKEWIGAPYRFGGTSRSTGIDCSAFVQKFYKDIYGLEISRTCYYQYQETERIRKEDIQIGDIIFFNSRLSPSGWHAGIYIGGGEFIHAANYRSGVKISCLHDPMYERIYKGAGRIRNK